MLLAACVLAEWVADNVLGNPNDPTGLVRIILAVILCPLILLREGSIKARETRGHASVMAAAVGGSFAFIIGIVAGVHQAQWIGLLILNYACLSWVMPPTSRIDIRNATLTAYWVHPLP